MCPQVYYFLFFSKVHSQSKSTLGCYIIETAASVASNDVRIMKVSGNAKLLQLNQKILSVR